MLFGNFVHMDYRYVKKIKRKKFRDVKKKIMETRSLVSEMTQFVLFKLEKTW